MDIINNGTSDRPLDSGEILFKFKVITYKLEDTDKQMVNNKIKNLYKELFIKILNKNDSNNILKKLYIPNNEKYIRHICVWKSGLCSETTNIKISPKCSIPSPGKEILNRYTISYNDNRNNMDFKIQDNEKNKIGWKNHIINGIEGNRNNTTYECNIYDINYNIKGNELFTLDLYDSRS